MTNEEFANFLTRLKELKINNADFAKYSDYSAESISHFRNSKRELPKILVELVKLLIRFDEIGIDIKKIIKNDK